MKTSAQTYYYALGDVAGTLFYLNRKDGSTEEYILEPLIIDTKNKDLTIKALQRVMDNPNFIAFPGTFEFVEFMNEVENLKNKQYLYSMTITFTPEHLYIGIILILVGLQIYQLRLVNKLEKECDDIWAQLGTLVGNITSQILSLQKELNDKQDKK